MKQKKRYLDWISSWAILFAFELLGSTQTFAAGPAMQTGTAELPLPAFVGGLPVVDPGAVRPQKPGTVYSAYDVEAIDRHLEPGDTAGAIGIDPVQTAAIVPGVFGSVAIPMRNFPVSARWTPIYRAIGSCAGGACAEASKAFATAVKSARNKGFLDKLEGINRDINRLIAYKRDKAIYGSLDHWARPREILKRGAGDCEDFAILKMAALLDAGIPAQSMALVVLQDSQKGVFHAVLSVATDGGTFILDNVRNNVVKDTSLPSYVPLYSFSTNRAWIHGSKAGGPQVAQTKGGFASVAPGEGPQEAVPARRTKKAGWMPAIGG